MGKVTKEVSEYFRQLGKRGGPARAKVLTFWMIEPSFPIV